MRSYFLCLDVFFIIFIIMFFVLMSSHYVLQEAAAPAAEEQQQQPGAVKVSVIFLSAFSSLIYKKFTY